MKSVMVNIDNDDLIFYDMEDDKMTYKGEINKFEENTGVTIQNISFPIEENFYYIKLSDAYKKYTCGNFLENLFLEIKKQTDNVLIILDFEEVEELSESFYNAYTKLLLRTSNKIISINMDTYLTNEYASFVKRHIY